MLTSCRMFPNRSVSVKTTSAPTAPLGPLSFRGHPTHPPLLARIHTTHLFRARAAAFPALFFQPPPAVAVFPKPLQRNGVQRGVRTQINRRPARRHTRKRPRRGLHQERPEVHVGHMRREVVQAVEYMRRVCKRVRMRRKRGSGACKNVQRMVAPRVSESSFKNVSRSSRTRTSRSTVTYSGCELDVSAAYKNGAPRVQEP